MLKVYIGWDQRDALACEVCRQSLLKHASVPVETIALKDWELRAKGLYWRPYQVDERGQMWDARDGKHFSTNFSYPRFCMPLLKYFGPDVEWETVGSNGSLRIGATQYRPTFQTVQFL